VETTRVGRKEGGRRKEEGEMDSAADNAHETLSSRVRAASVEGGWESGVGKEKENEKETKHNRVMTWVENIQPRVGEKTRKQEKRVERMKLIEEKGGNRQRKKKELRPQKGEGPGLV